MKGEWAMRRFGQGWLVLVLAAFPCLALAQDETAGFASDRPAASLGRPIGTSRPAPIDTGIELVSGLPQVFPPEVDLARPLTPEQSRLVLPAPVVPASTVVDMPRHADEFCSEPSGRPGHRFLGFAEVLSWTVHNSAVPFAQPFDSVDPFRSVPRGAVGLVDPGYRGGIRAGAGASVGESDWLLGTFTSFQDSAHGHLPAPAGTVLHSNLIFPSTINAAFAPLAADARYDIHLDLADIDYKHSIVDYDCFKLDWIAGARFGHLTQSLSASYQEAIGAESVRTHIGFDGGGLRVGLDGEYRMPGGLFSYGKGMLNLLAGRFGGSYEQRDFFGEVVARTDIRERRLVPVTEMEIGIGWAGPGGHLRVSLGYNLSSWFNTLTTTSLVRGVQNNNFTTNGNNFRDVLSFDGLAARIEFRY